MRTGRYIPVLAFVLMATSFGRTQTHVGYEFRSLHPIGATYSRAVAAYGGKQVGRALLQAVLWGGTPDVVRYYGGTSQPGAMFGRRIGGYTDLGGGSWHATLWDRDAGPSVELHDPAYARSEAYGLDGSSQVGYVWNYDGPVRARQWFGSPTRFRELLSPDFVNTTARGVFGNRQVGEGWNEAWEERRPLLWNGSQPPVDILGMIRSSDGNAVGGAAVAIDGDHVVGSVVVHLSYPDPWGRTEQTHGAFWDLASGRGFVCRGWVFDTDDVTDGGEIRAVAGNLGVGMFGAGGARRAEAWQFDGQYMLSSHLYRFLPPSYVHSEASGIDPVTGDIVGQADTEAVIWKPVPAQYLTVKATGGEVGCTMDLQFRTTGRFWGYFSPDATLVYRTGAYATLAPQPVLNNYRVFDHLEVDGVRWAGPIRMDRDHTATPVYTTGYPLQITSSNPSSGVTITVWHPDHLNRRDGDTSFERVYRAGKSVGVTAPAVAGSGMVFDHWEKDGVPVNQTARTITVLMDGPHSLKAVYVQGRVLSIGSESPESGVFILVYQPDKFGLRDAETPFTRVYAAGSQVSLTAPPEEANKPFDRWIIDGVAQARYVRTITVALNADRAVRAVYSSTPSK